MDIEIRRVQEGDLDTLRAAQRDLAADDFAFAFDLDDGPEFDFAAWVERCHRAERGEDIREGWVPHTFLVAFDGDTAVGRVSIRHELNEFLATWGGHIGYGVVSSHRRRGIATRLLAAGLDVLRGLGVERALITCDHDNAASAAIIEAAGGVFESQVDDPSDHIPKRRYWIVLR